MRVVYYVGAGLLTAILTFVLASVITRVGMKYRVYAKIRERDVHTRPTPRLGGIAMFLGMVITFGIASQIAQFHLIFARPGPILAILGSAFIVVAIGVADDLWDLDWTLKLAVQIIAAGLLAWQGVQLTSLPIPGGVILLPSYIGLIITVLAIVLVMNAVNFIDGLDGLVAGVVIIASSVFFIYSYILANQIAQTEYFNLASLITAVLIGACAGFLPLNWHPAKLFMGDAGSMLVGLLMATSAISITGQVDVANVQFARQLVPAFIPILLPFAILIVPLLDFCLAVIRRLLAGKSPFSADRKHLHHRLLDMGHTDVRAVIIFYAWTTVVAVGCLLFLFLPTVLALTFVAIGMVICTAITLAPLSSRKAVEVAAQLAAPVQNAETRSAPAETPAARFDPLDAASERNHDERPGTASDATPGLATPGLATPDLATPGHDSLTRKERP